MADNVVVSKGVQVIHGIVYKFCDAIESANEMQMPNSFREIKKLNEQSSAFLKIASNLQKKYEINTRQEKLSILALSPDDWTFSQ